MTERDGFADAAEAAELGPGEPDATVREGWNGNGDGYRGPAVLTVAGGGEYQVRVDLRGRFEPIDGRYHWYGRAESDLPDGGNVTGTLRITPQASGVSQTSQSRRASQVSQVSQTEQAFQTSQTRQTPEVPEAPQTVQVSQPSQTSTFDHPAVPCRIGDRDLWGRWRLSGEGAPPFPLAEVPAEPDEPAADRPTEVGIVVVGTGFGGLGAAIKLREAGFEDLVVLERAGSVGGTWRANTYPGCACDVPSNLYSFSFAPNPSWTHGFSSQPEIRGYLERVADRCGLRPLIRFDTTVLDSRWDPSARRWRLNTSRGELTARILIGATGPLADPAVPDIPGIADFPGPVLHTGAWDDGVDLTGKRVAVIGTGASAIQLVPAIADRVSELTLFQRTPAWVMARRDRTLTSAEHWLYRHLPATQKAARLGLYLSREATVGAFTKHPQVLRRAQALAKRNLTKAIADPDLRARLTPDYVMGCKRVLLSDTYYPALAGPNTTLIDSGLARVEGNTLISSDGRNAEVDVLAFATGFHPTDLPVAEHIYNGDGRSLAEVWAGDMNALRGTTVSGFPNMCFVIGPNTGLGHNSMVHIIESQLSYIVSYVKELRDLESSGRTPVLDARPEAQRRWNGAVAKRMERTVWSTGGCVSWYQNAAGRNPTLWPASTITFRRATRRIDAAEYEQPADTGVSQAGQRPQHQAEHRSEQQTEHPSDQQTEHQSDQQTGHRTGHHSERDAKSSEPQEAGR
jgi:cation diffusion facilitator CzcD-associated flavoprotein CzcO